MRAKISRATLLAVPTLLVGGIWLYSRNLISPQVAVGGAIAALVGFAALDLRRSR